MFHLFKTIRLLIGKCNQTDQDEEDHVDDHLTNNRPHLNFFHSLFTSMVQFTFTQPIDGLARSINIRRILQRRKKSVFFQKKIENLNKLWDRNFDRFPFDYHQAIHFLLQSYSNFDKNKRRISLMKRSSSVLSAESMKIFPLQSMSTIVDFSNPQIRCHEQL